MQYEPTVKKISSGYSSIFLWITTIILIFTNYSLAEIPLWYFALPLTIVYFIISIIKINNPYQETVIIRLGKFHRIGKEGIYIVLPFVENGSRVDKRVSTNTFKAEQTLTKDNVPVNVDAVLFWKVNDSKKAILNIQDFFDSIMKASMTALRDSIGKASLSEMISQREMIDKQLKKTIDERAEDWGMYVDKVEIKDVRIPQSLQDAMSRQAQAEREKAARIIIADAEIESAKRMLEASYTYNKNPNAMKLRWMNQIYEIGLHGNGVILIPSDMPVAGLGGVLGLNDFMTRKKDKDKNDKNPDKKSE